MVTIPDAERRTRYTPSISTATFAVGFPIVAADDVEVWHNGVPVDPGDYSVTLGSLIDGFYSSANVVLDAGVTGTVDIVGARRPRRTVQFVEGKGIPARTLNQEASRDALERREAFDRLQRVLLMPPGSDAAPLLPVLIGGRVLQVKADQSGFEWVETGSQGPQGEAATIEIGTVTTLAPGSPATVENVGTETDAIFNFGIPQGDEGAPGDGSGDVNGPSGATDGHAAVFQGATGKILRSAGAAPSLFGHNHDDRYYTEAEIDALAAGFFGGTVQQANALLDAIAALSMVADRYIYGTGDGTVALGTISALARTILARTGAGNMRSDLAAAARTQTQEGLPIFIKLAVNENFDDVYPFMPHGGTLTAVRRIAKSGSCTIQLRKNGANWGSALSVTTSLQSETGLSLTWEAGDRIGYTVSSASSCVGLGLIGTYTRALE